MILIEENEKNHNILRINIRKCKLLLIKSAINCFGWDDKTISEEI